ncbi:MAG: outer membrane lipoprotein carrier protein LolA [Rhodobacteraceae bacterium]|jgi:outer membrane lipoprotein-sorting protein|nr:outer membrane lipoprotein carrier protein LolA [Paracoccaceae bacterium]
MDPLRRSLLLAPLALAIVGAPAFAAPLSLSEVSQYLNAIQTAESTFTQINADGSRSTGRVFIHRPNRMRFEYAAPNEALVLASAGQVAVFDAKSNQPPEQYPLRRTPLNLILGRDIDLGRARMVVAHGEEQGMTTVTAQDPEHPEYGTIKLYFSASPVALRQWVVTDETGYQTTVVLDGLQTGASYPPSLFSIQREMQRR